MLWNVHKDKDYRNKEHRFNNTMSKLKTFYTAVNQEWNIYNTKSMQM